MDLPAPHADGSTSGPASSPAAGAAWFAFFATVGVAAIAAAVLLPEVADLAKLQARRDALAHQLRCEQRLASYYAGLIKGMRTDPVVTARLLMRHANYSPAGCRPLATDPAGRVETVPAQILRQAANPPSPPQGLVVLAGKWLSDPPTRLGLILLGLAVVAAAGWLFGGLGRTRRPAA